MDLDSGSAKISSPDRHFGRSEGVHVRVKASACEREEEESTHQFRRRIFANSKRQSRPTAPRASSTISSAPRHTQML
jgi:hypothetical protein